MHGIIFLTLEEYVIQELGPNAWRDLLGEAGLGSKSYFMDAYPDEELFAALHVASNKTGKDIQILLREFGRYLVPRLVDMYRPLIAPGWSAMDLLEHTETSIHTVVRQKNPEATPPELRCERLSETEVAIRYGSKRKLCALGKGIIEGVADHYHVNFDIQESVCMLDGADRCEIHIRKND